MLVQPAAPSRPPLLLQGALHPREADRGNDLPSLPRFCLSGLGSEGSSRAQGSREGAGEKKHYQGAEAVPISREHVRQ